MFDEYIKEYKEKGIVVIPGVFTEDEMDLVRQESYMIEPMDIRRAGYKHRPFEIAKNKLSLLFFPALVGGHLNNIRTDKRMTDIVRAFIGDDVKQVNNQVYFRESGDEDEFAWHQDIVFREPRDRFPGVEDGYLQTIIAVDDITIDNGAIEFIDGSHKHGEQELTSNPALTKMLRTFKRHGLEGKKYTAPAGSVILWNVLTVHGSEQNVSDQNRMTYMNGFCRSENCLDFPDYLIDGEVVKHIDPDLIP